MKNSQNVAVLNKISKPTKRETMQKMYVDSFRKLSKLIEKKGIYWRNPLTNHAVGYQRASDLGLIKSSFCGILNPNSNRLIGYARARRLGLVIG